MSKNNRNLALIFVESNGFASLFREGFKWRSNGQIVKGIPKDAKVEYTFATPERHGVMIMLSSKEFKPVPDGSMPPMLVVEISVD